MASKRRPEAILERFGDPFGKENRALSALGSVTARESENARKIGTLSSLVPGEFIYIYIYIYINVDTYIYRYVSLEQPGLTLEREAPLNFIAKVSLKQAKQNTQSNHTKFLHTLIQF